MDKLIRETNEKGCEDNGNYRTCEIFALVSFMEGPLLLFWRNESSSDRMRPR